MISGLTWGDIPSNTEIDNTGKGDSEPNRDKQLIEGNMEKLLAMKKKVI
jgi:hypothetical protein